MGGEKMKVLPTDAFEIDFCVQYSFLRSDVTQHTEVLKGKEFITHDGKSRNDKEATIDWRWVKNRRECTTSGIGEASFDCRLQQSGLPEIVGTEKLLEANDVVIVQLSFAE